MFNIAWVNNLFYFKQYLYKILNNIQYFISIISIQYSILYKNQLFPSDDDAGNYFFTSYGNTIYNLAFYYVTDNIIILFKSF